MRKLKRHWTVMSECIRPQGHVVLIDDPVEPIDITAFKLKSVTISWEFMYTRSMFGTDDMSEQGKLLSTVAGLLRLIPTHCIHQKYDDMVRAIEAVLAVITQSDKI
jgi:hypothetical protein